MIYFKYKNETTAVIEHDDESLRDFDILREHFKTENESIRFVKAYRSFMSPYKYEITPLGKYNIGLTQEICEICRKLNIDYKIEEDLVNEVRPSFNFKEILSVPNEQYKYRDYQERLIKSLADNGRGVIISPTRSGKSLIIAGLIHNVFQHVNDYKIQNVLIVVPNIQLVFQFADDLTEYGLGKYYNIQPFTAKTMSKKNAKLKIEPLNIYIANTQYLMLHGEELPFTDMVFCDECHQCKKTSEISKILKSLKIRNKFGCTGTLPSSLIDKWMISGIFGPVVDEVEIKKLQEQKVLADVKIYPIKFKHIKHQNFNIPEIDENGNVEDKFSVAQKASRKEQIFLNTYEESNKIILNISKKIITEHPDWNVLILFDYTNQGEQLFKLLSHDNKHYVDGSIDVKERLNIVEQMDESGGHILIAQSKTFSTGITISRLNVIFLLNADTAATKIIQSIGRGLRRQNKNAIIVFDIFHNYKYSEKHYEDRLKLYNTFYNLVLNRDFKNKEVYLSNDDLIQP